MNHKFSIKLPLNVKFIEQQFKAIRSVKNLYISVNPVFSIRYKGNNIVTDGQVDLAIQPSPIELDFGSVEKDGLLENSVSLHNTGNLPLMITRAEMDNGFFFLASGVRFPFLLNPGQKKIIKLRFTSSLEGLHQGLLTFYSNTLDHPPVTLTARVRRDVIRLSPPTIDFGKVKTTVSHSFTLRVWNQGNIPLKISAGAITHARFSVSATWPLVVPPGTAGRIEIRFLANDTLAQEGKLQLTLDEPFKTILSVPLFGMGRTVFPDHGSENMGSWEASNAVNTSVKQLIKDTLVFKKTDCLDLLENFNKVIRKNDPFRALNLSAVRLTDSIESKIQALVQSLLPLPSIGASYKELSLSPFNFQTYVGRYTWNRQLEEFSYTGNEKTIRIVFPETDSAANDCEMRIYEYEEQVLTTSSSPSRNYYQPTRILLSFHRKDVEVAMMDLFVQYHANGSAAKISGELLIHPFCLSLSMANASGPSTANALLHLSSKPIASLSLQAIFSGTTKTLKDLKTVEGRLNMMGVDINGVFDYALSEQKNPDKNALLKLVVLGELERKIGIEKIIDEWSQERDRNIEANYLVYNDDSRENIETLLKEWINLLNTFGH